MKKMTRIDQFKVNRYKKKVNKLKDAAKAKRAANETYWWWYLTAKQQHKYEDLVTKKHRLTSKYSWWIDGPFGRDITDEPFNMDYVRFTKGFTDLPGDKLDPEKEAKRLEALKVPDKPQFVYTYELDEESGKYILLENGRRQQGNFLRTVKVDGEFQYDDEGKAVVEEVPRYLWGAVEREEFETEGVPDETKIYAHLARNGRANGAEAYEPTMNTWKKKKHG